MKDKRLFSIYPNTIGFGYVLLNEKGEFIDDNAGKEIVKLAQKNDFNFCKVENIGHFSQKLSF